MCRSCVEPVYNMCVKAERDFLLDMSFVAELQRNEWFGRCQSKYIQLKLSIPVQSNILRNIADSCWILQFVHSFWVLQILAENCRVLMNKIIIDNIPFCKLCIILQILADLCRILQIFAESCILLKNLAYFLKNLADHAESCRFLQNIANPCRILQNFADPCRSLLLFPAKSWWSFVVLQIQSNLKNFLYVIHNLTDSCSI